MNTVDKNKTMHCLLDTSVAARSLYTVLWWLSYFRSQFPHSCWAFIIPCLNPTPTYLACRAALAASYLLTSSGNILSVTWGLISIYLCLQTVHMNTVSLLPVNLTLIIWLFHMDEEGKQTTRLSGKHSSPHKNGHLIVRERWPEMAWLGVWTHLEVMFRNDWCLRKIYTVEEDLCCYQR